MMRIVEGTGKQHIEDHAVWDAGEPSIKIPGNPALGGPLTIILWGAYAERVVRWLKGSANLVSTDPDIYTVDIYFSKEDIWFRRFRWQVIDIIEHAMHITGIYLGEANEPNHTR